MGPIPEAALISTQKSSNCSKIKHLLKKEELWAACSINSLIKPLSTTEMKGALLLALAEGNLCICLLKLLPHKVIEQHTHSEHPKGNNTLLNGFISLPITILSTHSSTAALNAASSSKAVSLRDRYI